MLEACAVANGGRNVQAMRLRDDGVVGDVATEVIQEEALTVEVVDVASYLLMWTPTRPAPGAVGFTAADGVLADEAAPEPIALATGFLFTEGVIDCLEDVADMAVCPQRPDVVRVRLAHPGGVAVRRRNVVVSSSCGICGGREQLMERIAAVQPAGDRLRVAAGDLSALVAALQRRQRVFRDTGGAHAAMIFGAELGVRAFAEDLGRHNALDKVIGEQVLRGEPFAGCGVLVSSRLSYEMVAKCARAGVELVAAISAPTSLAIDIAERAGITLCAFVRGGGAEVYTHPGRVRT